MAFTQFAQQISNRLGVWAGLSVGSGAALATAEDEFLQGVGEQFIGWGAIDGLIALGGAWQNGRRGPLDEVQEAAEFAKLRRILWLNAFLDVGYVLGGWWLIRTKGEQSARWRGRGLGIILQGGFLLVFDIIHALRRS
jgi:hypothetical protein